MPLCVCNCAFHRAHVSVAQRLIRSSARGPKARRAQGPKSPMAQEPKPGPRSSAHLEARAGALLEASDGLAALADDASHKALRAVHHGLHAQRRHHHHHQRRRRRNKATTTNNDDNGREEAREEKEKGSAPRVYDKRRCLLACALRVPACHFRVRLPRTWRAPEASRRSVFPSGVTCGSAPPAKDTWRALQRDRCSEIVRRLRAKAPRAKAPRAQGDEVRCGEKEKTEPTKEQMRNGR